MPPKRVGAKRGREDESALNAVSGCSTGSNAVTAVDCVASGRPKRAFKAPAMHSESPQATVGIAGTEEELSKGPTLPLTTESRLWNEHPYALIAGVDEAGRGPLCGPVVASCCIILPPPLWPSLLAPATEETRGGETGPWRAPVLGVADSKTVDEEDRESIFPSLVSDPRFVFGTAVVDHATIDRVNILRATMLAMDTACASAIETAREVLSRLGHGGASCASSSTGILDVSHPRWSTPFGGQAPGHAGARGGRSGESGLGPAGVDPFLRLHTVLIDGNKCPPGLVMACDGPDEHAKEKEVKDEGVEEKECGINEGGHKKGKGRGKGRGGPSSAAKAQPIKPVEDEAYARTVQALASTAMSRQAHGAGANTVAEDTGADAGGSQRSLLPSASSLTVGQVLSIRDSGVLAGANAEHATFSTTPALAARIGRVFTAQPVIGGDGKVYAIAAASLVAKVTRDRLMRSAGVAWPAYGLEGHKGYGTATHMAAISREGPCPIHRLTFAPLKDLYPLSAARAKGAAALTM